MPSGLTNLIFMKQQQLEWLQNLSRRVMHKNHALRMQLRVNASSTNYCICLSVIHLSYEHLLSMLLLFGGVRSWLRNKNDERVQQVFIVVIRRYVIRNKNVLIQLPPQYFPICTINLAKNKYNNNMLKGMFSFSNSYRS